MVPNHARYQLRYTRSPSEEARSIPFFAASGRERASAGDYTSPPVQTQEGIISEGSNLHLFHLTAEENCGILSEELFSGRFHFPDGSETVFSFPAKA